MKRTMRMTARTAALYVMLFGLSACGANSCSCDGFVQQEFPVAKVTKTIPSSGEVRLTSSGVTFLENNLPAIVSGLLPGGLSFCVPPTSQSGLNVCDDGSTCSDGSPGCDMTLTIDDADIIPTPPSTLDISITIGGLDETLPVRVIGSNCTLQLYSKADNSMPAQILGSLPMEFEVDSASPFNDVRINVGEADVNVDDVDFDIDGVGILDIPICEGVDALAAIGFIRDLALGVLTDQFTPLIQDQLDAQLCVQCAAGCPAGTTCGGGDVCRYGDDTCAQSPLGISGQLELGTVLAGYTETSDATVDLTLRVADTAVVDTGLTLGLRSGYDPVETALCVPVDPTTRDFQPVPLSPTVTGNATPLGQPFHFGLGYHKKAIEHMLWSVWGSGGTCLYIGSDSIDLLTTGALGALLPSVRQLAYSKSSAAYVKIVPQKPPNVILGTNAVTPNGSSYTVDDPLMTIDWKDFDVHIYAFAQDRMTRVVTIRMDLLLPIALVSDGMGSIIPIIGDIENAFTNERIINGELVAEDPDRILDLLPTLIGFALPSLAGSISQPVELPEFFGFRLDIPEQNITSVDNATSIAIFANLVVAGTPVIPGTETAIGGTRVDLSNRTPSGLVKPTVFVDMLPVGALLGEYTPNVEYSYRVNGGTWSLYERTSQLAIDDPMFLLPGEHTIEVRGRQVGMPATVDHSPDSTTVVIDWEAPLVNIERTDNIVTLETSDLDAEQLEMRTKIVDGKGTSTWSGWTPVEDLDLNTMGVPDRFRLEVEVRDRAGNVGRDEQTVTWRMPLERESLPTTSTETPSATAPKSGCSSTGGSGPADLGWLLLVAGMLAFRPRRRRRRRLRIEALGLAVILCFGACKCGDDSGQNELCEPACAAGLQCVAGVCITAPQCTIDDDCGEGETCVSGECINQPSCEELCDCADGELAVCEDDTCGCVPYCDKGCEDGEYCCYDSNSCEALPDPCADVMCEIGFGPVQTSDPSGDSPTCEVAAGACECQELPPLPLGWHGHYAAIDRNGGVTGVAAYNSTYEDLMVGVVDASLNVTWDFVDGVPTTGDVEGSLNGPRGGIADKGEDVGRFTALAIDDAGTFHVFYRDHDRGVLKYARGTVGGTWDIEDADTEGDVGFWASALHDGGRIHLVYTAKSAPGAGGFVTELRHLAFDASGALSDANATRVVISSGVADHPCGSDCENRDDVCFANLGQCMEPSNDCTEACAAGSACNAGTCELTHEEPPVGTLQAIGTHAQLTTTANGLFVSYWDYIQDSAAYASFDGTAWGAPAYVGAGTGPWVSGMQDDAGNVHIAYMQTVDDVPQLMYQDVTNTTTEIIQDGIRDTVDWWLVNTIGEDVDLRLAADGSPIVIYQDATAHTLRMATRAGGSWSVSDVAAPGNYTGAHGFYSSMLKLPDAQFSVELTVNNQLDPTEASPTFHE